MPLRQEDTKTVRRGPQVLSKRRLPNTIDRRRESLPPPDVSLVQIARVPGSAAGGRCENGWRRRRLRCATQTDGAACRRERSAARPRRVRAVARFAIDELTGRDSYEARRAEPAPKAAFKKVKGRSPVARRRVPCSRASLQQGSTGRSSPSNDRGKKV